MKHRIRIKRKDDIRQRYWVGRTLRKNYGSQMVRRQIRKDLQILPEEKVEIRKKLIKSRPDSTIKEFLPREHRREELVRVFEKNPELYDEFKIRKPTILFHTGETSSTLPILNTISISDEDTLGKVGYEDGVYKTKGLEPHLRHEIKHVTDSILSKGKYDDAPELLRESSANSAEHISIRNYKTPKRIVEQNIKDFFGR